MARLTAGARAAPRAALPAALDLLHELPLPLRATFRFLPFDPFTPCLYTPARLYDRYLKQFPVLPPDRYLDADLAFIVRSEEHTV